MLIRHTPPPTSLHLISSPSFVQKNFGPFFLQGPSLVPSPQLAPFSSPPPFQGTQRQLFSFPPFFLTRLSPFLFFPKNRLFFLPPYQEHVFPFLLSRLLGSNFMLAFRDTLLSPPSFFPLAVEGVLTLFLRGPCFTGAFSPPPPVEGATFPFSILYSGPPISSSANKILSLSPQEIRLSFFPLFLSSSLTGLI